MKKYFMILVVIIIYMSCSHNVKCEEDITFIWYPPILNVDGTLLVDLAGFKFYDNKIEIKDLGNVLKYTHRVTQGDHSFTVTAYDKNKYESKHSEPVKYSPICS